MVWQLVQRSVRKQTAFCLSIEAHHAWKYICVDHALDAIQKLTSPDISIVNQDCTLTHHANVNAGKSIYRELARLLQKAILNSKH